MNGNKAPNTMETRMGDNMEIKYIDNLFWIIGDNGEIIEELGGFIDFISPQLIIKEVEKECK